MGSERDTIVRGAPAGCSILILADEDDGCLASSQSLRTQLLFPERYKGEPETNDKD